VTRALASAAVVVTGYYMLPFDRTTTWSAVTLLVIELVVLTGLVAFYARSVIRSPFPSLRAIEALGTSLSAALVLFASTYYVMARLTPGSFSAPLTRTDVRTA